MFSVLAAVVAAVFLLARFGTRDADDRTMYSGITLLTGGLAIILFTMSCLTIVSTRNVGVVTTFGKPSGTLTNGLHLIAPWQKVPELSGTIQTNSQTGGFRDGKCDGGTPVRLANNSTACIDNTVRWRIVPTAADALFRDYRNDETIRDSLVTRELNAVMAGVFATYNPLATDSAAPRLEDLSKAVTTQIQAKIGAQIEVLGVIINLVHVDAATQDKVNAYQSQIAATRIAEESQRTAAAQAQANRVLADSVSRDPNVLVAQCLELVASGKPLPAGFQCWPGTGLATTIPAR
ncbi:SPFH domain-containing protein [Nocardia asteroides]|uniref:SPFH domain-containing protein n=1 Tax=Nocardia asteroides TaxID=1824 RepID=UPI0037CC4033